ncbi:MAG: hypothetical protein ACOX4F_07310 [Atopobiaceae bacterium]|jgi:hypothetical protein
MADESAPLSSEERAELEELRREKAQREAAEKNRRERAELERLRREKEAQATPRTHEGARVRDMPAREREQARQAQAARTREEVLREQAARTREEAARERGRKLMEPDDDLRMPQGQKLVLLGVALLALFMVLAMIFNRRPR